VDKRHAPLHSASCGRGFAAHLESERRRSGSVRLIVEIDAQPNDADIFQNADVVKEVD
jgi:hypothetical protein